jgi:hypothetical protein
VNKPSHRDELVVLSLIGGGMILTVVLVVIGIFGWFESKTNVPLPNWAENVLVSIISIFAVKIGDVLAALVTLAVGRQVEKMGDRLAESGPASKDPVPEDATQAADQMLAGAEETHDQIVGDVK